MIIKFPEKVTEASLTQHENYRAIMLFIAADLASITSHIHNWVLFLLWRHLFILFGVISPLIYPSPKVRGSD